MISNIIFIIILIAGTYFFTVKVKEVMRNINLGRPVDRSDRKAERWKTMALVALGQSKMLNRPVAAIFHIFIYVGFVIINIEVLEIIIDGITGTHRILSFLGSFYDFLIASFEILAVLVLAACVVFLARRNILKIKRFWSKEMTAWPRTDANLILITEILLMSAFLTMNACDWLLQQHGYPHYVVAGAYPVSSMLASNLTFLTDHQLFLLERTCWWFHIIGILVFLNYVPYSKHFHILLAFPNTWYSNLDAKGGFTNPENVTNEVKLMFDPAAVVTPLAENAQQKFGAKDIHDLTWKQLMDAYSCTECGRCTSVCPANITGKKLSPRKIMMDTRDRVEEVGRQLNKKIETPDGKSLLGDYITNEELWACTTCNACVEACPVNIDPLSIIVDLRRYLIMEQSTSPTEWNGMFSKIENNGAPWQFPQADRKNWVE